MLNGRPIMLSQKKRKGTVHDVGYVAQKKYYYDKCSVCGKSIKSELDLCPEHLKTHLNKDMYGNKMWKL